MKLNTLLTSAIMATALLTGADAQAQRSQDRLVFLSEREPPSYDFFMQTNREGVILNRMMFDGLVRTDPVTGEVTPGLATEWEYIDPVTIRFRLREGVTFHNGDGFTADDVAFTVEYNNNPENRTVARSRTNWIERVEVHGPYELTLRLHSPFPAAMEFLNANVPVYPRAYFESVGTEGFSANPVGTGRYRVERAELGREIVLRRNHDYWGGPDDNGHIETIVMRFVPERNTQVAELMSGNAHLIWQVPADQATRMERLPNISVVLGDTMRYAYLQFESGLRPNARPSPVHDARVRQAIAHAIDRQSIVDNIMGGGTVLHLPCYTTQFGCEAPDAPIYAYDPERARMLLAEAGFPNGFTINFYGYRDRPVAEAVMGYLSAVGIETSLQWLQYSALRDRVRNGEIEFNFMAWGSSSINDIANSVSYFFRGTPDDTALDPDVIQWLTEGDSAVEREERLVPYRKALTRIMEEVYKVPMFSYAYFYAMSADLEFTPTPDEIVHLYDARWR